MLSCLYLNYSLECVSNIRLAVVKIFTYLEIIVDGQLVLSDIQGNFNILHKLTLVCNFIL